jgi:hypothetical protein
VRSANSRAAWTSPLIAISICEAIIMCLIVNSVDKCISFFGLPLINKVNLISFAPSNSFAISAHALPFLGRPFGLRTSPFLAGIRLPLPPTPFPLFAPLFFLGAVSYTHLTLPTILRV